MFKNKSSMMIISILAAIVLWLYVMGEVDPETRTKITNIPVNFVGTEELAVEGMAVAYDKQMFISAVINGKRSDVNEAKKNGLTASVDVTDCRLGENTRKIIVSLPVGVRLENVSEATLTFDVETLVYESKPVVIKFSQSTASGDVVSETTPWVLAVSPELITVSGAESSVSKVDRLVGTIDPEEAVKGESKWVDVPLIPVSSKGREVLNVTLNTDLAQAEIRELMTKEVKVELTDGSESIEPNEVGLQDKIKIVGTKDSIKSIEVIEGIVTEEDGNIYIYTELPKNVFVMIGEEDGKIIWN